jgi:TonB family protein
VTDRSPGTIELVRPKRPAASARRNGVLHFGGVTLAALVFAVACASNPKPRNRTVSAGRSPGDTINCLDTLRAADSIPTIVKMTVSPQDAKVELPSDFENMFVEEFRSHFRVPPKLPLSVVMGSQPCDSLGSRCVGGVLSLGAVAYATAHNDGRLSDIVVIDAARTPRFADSVNSALESMSREQLVPPVGNVDSISVILQIVAEEQPDTVPTVRHVFRALVPRYAWPFSYASMPAAGVDAKYPYTARLAGIEDSVMLAFTVESDGTIAAGSIELVSATYRDFVTSVLDALGRTRYHPAHLGDCAVATRMRQRFLFKEPE